MAISQKNQKELKRNSLLRHATIPKNTRAIILSFTQDKDIRTFLETACEALNITLISDFSKEDMLYIEGADAFVTDVISDTVPLSRLIQNQVVPILPAQLEHFQEFNPMKFEGNAFLFEEVTKFHILEKIIRYLENIRYPGDKRMLLQNVEKTKIK